MGVTTGGSADDAAAFPLRLSLTLVLPLRLAEVKDNVPCFKLPERCALVELDLCGAMIVVVKIVLVLWVLDLDPGHIRHCFLM
jgi:hypothetical protein